MTLYMRDLENIKIGKEQGKEEEREQGVRAFILDSLEEHTPKEKTILKLKKIFRLTDEDADEYYTRFSSGE